MIKKSIYITILALFFSGCAAERGSIQLSTPNKHSKRDNTIRIKHNESIPTLVVHAKKNKVNTVENRVTGGLVLLIGLLILL